MDGWTKPRGESAFLNYPQSLCHCPPASRENLKAGSSGAQAAEAAVAQPHIDEEVRQGGEEIEDEEYDLPYGEEEIDGEDEEEGKLHIIEQKYPQLT